MEFFVAKKLAREFKANGYASLEKVCITHEVAAFFADYFEKEKEILIRALLGNSNANVRAACALAIGFFGHKKEHFDALSLCLRTDESLVVKNNAIDSVSKWGTSDALELLMTLVSTTDDVSLIALRSLRDYIIDSAVLHLFIDILIDRPSPNRVKIALEALEHVDDESVNQVLLGFCQSKSWVGDGDVTKCLIKAIPSKHHLHLVLELDTIEENSLEALSEKKTSEEISSFLIAAKSEVKSKFNAEIKRDAEQNRANGLIYSKNEGALRAKYRFLITDTWLKNILPPLYGTSISSKDQSKLEDEKKLTTASSRRAKGARG